MLFRSLKKIALQEREKEFDEAGKIIAIDKDSIVVTCKRGAIRIFRVQPNSKKEMDITSYINGKRVVLEDTLS